MLPKSFLCIAATVYRNTKKQIFHKYLSAIHLCKLYLRRKSNCKKNKNSDNSDSGYYLLVMLP